MCYLDMKKIACQTISYKLKPFKSSSELEFVLLVGIYISIKYLKVFAGFYFK